MLCHSQTQMHKVSAEHTHKQTIGVASQTEHTWKDTALPRNREERVHAYSNKKQTAAPVRGILWFCEVR